MRLILWCLVALMSVQIEGPASAAWGKSAYRMEGVVTDADTRLPVANAMVQVLITSEPDPAKKIRKAATDEEGRYSIDLPAGHGWAWYPVPPEGYAAVEINPTEVFATTDDSPVFTKDYELRRGTPLKFVVRYPKSLAKLPKTYVSLNQVQGNNVKFASGELDEKGNGSLTVLQPVGKFLLFCGNYEGTLAAPEEMAIEFEEGFDPRDVAQLENRGKAGTVTVRDGAGRAATFTKCEATVHEKQLAVAIDVEAAPSNSVKLDGSVVDDAGNGIEGATVTLTFHSGGGSASSQFSTETDEGGKFSIPVSLRSPEQKVGLCITREDFGGLDTKPMTVASRSGAVDVGQITLKPASSIRVRVVGADGKPLHGAVVEPENDYASRTRISRTNADGECVLTDLASGIMRVSARFGKDAIFTKIPLLPGENEVVVLKLKPTADVAAAAPAPPPPTLADGTPAPEWTIAEWTDGKDRDLADYRGKVLVLDFWGVWCGPCIEAVPAGGTASDGLLALHRTRDSMLPAFAAFNPV
jgi:thiol-disulfide isomerase/thioredoxin